MLRCKDQNSFLYDLVNITHILFLAVLPKPYVIICHLKRNYYTSFYWEQHEPISTFLIVFVLFSLPIPIPDLVMSVCWRQHVRFQNACFWRPPVTPLWISATIVCEECQSVCQSILLQLCLFNNLVFHVVVYTGKLHIIEFYFKLYL